MRQSYTSNAKQRAERSSVFGGGRQRIRRKARAFGTQEQFRKHGRAQRPSPTRSFHTPARAPATRFIINKTNQRAERSSVFGGGRQRIRREATVFDTQQETWQPREGRCALPYAELVNTANIKSQKPANQREEGWNVEWACLKAYPNQQSDLRKQNVRRHRHDRGTSTPRAHCHQENSLPQADTAAIPYAESPKQRNWLVNH